MKAYRRGIIVPEFHSPRVTVENAVNVGRKIIHHLTFIQVCMIYRGYLPASVARNALSPSGLL